MRSCMARLLLVGCGLLTACASVQKLAKEGVRKPEVAVTGAQLQALSFESAEFLFDIQVHNPNAVGVTLAGLDYELRVNEVPFLDGNQSKGVEIPAEGTTLVRLPMSVRFRDVYQTLATLSRRDSASYTLTCGLTFDLPVAGRSRVPVSHGGTFPLLKLPEFEVASMKLHRLTFEEADLQLNLRIHNPNAIGFEVQALEYEFIVEDRRWAQGEIRRNAQVSAAGASLVAIPVSVNFARLGSYALNLISDGRPFVYRLKGHFDLVSSHPMVQGVRVRFNRTGQLQVEE